MIISTKGLLQELKEYANPMAKISRMVKNGEIIPVIRGMYVRDKNISRNVLAGAIYGPSYVSFETALAHYGLIPERVYSVTSATFRKRRTKCYRTKLGTFFYTDIPAKAYPYGLRYIAEQGTGYFMASPEKAICDKLYSVSPCQSQKELEYILFDNLRIDEDMFWSLDLGLMCSLANLYNNTTIKVLVKYIINRQMEVKHE
ncbi:MAG: hypothetical protein GX959_03530 [Clostridiales bacterium]|jgi:predicted transcriptional regulator of viral defense system|nr:hypothetical protein [Clostridiales bacterium]